MKNHTERVVASMLSALGKTIEFLGKKEQKLEASWQTTTLGVHVCVCVSTTNSAAYCEPWMVRCPESKVRGMAFTNVN